jgi:hypothetical protein
MTFEQQQKLDKIRQVISQRSIPHLYSEQEDIPEPETTIRKSIIPLSDTAYIVVQQEGTYVQIVAFEQGIVLLVEDFEIKG